MNLLSNNKKKKKSQYINEIQLIDCAKRTSHGRVTQILCPTIAIRMIRTCYKLMDGENDTDGGGGGLDGGGQR